MFRCSLVLGYGGAIIAVPGALIEGTVGLILFNIGIFLAVIGLSTFATLNPSLIDFNKVIMSSYMNRFGILIFQLLPSFNYLGFFFLQSL